MHRMPLAILFFATVSRMLDAQGVAAVYVDQFRALEKQTRQVATQISESEHSWKSSREVVVTLHERLGALQKIAHRLEETAADEDLKLVRANRKTDKTLLLVAQACKAADFTLSALYYYVDTNDRAFLGFARTGLDLVAAISKVF